MGTGNRNEIGTKSKGFFCIYLLHEFFSGHDTTSHDDKLSTIHESRESEALHNDVWFYSDSNCSCNFAYSCCAGYRVENPNCSWNCGSSCGRWSSSNQQSQHLYSETVRNQTVEVNFSYLLFFNHFLDFFV